MYRWHLWAAKKKIKGWVFLESIEIAPTPTELLSMYGAGRFKIDDSLEIAPSYIIDIQVSITAGPAQAAPERREGTKPLAIQGTTSTGQHEAAQTQSAGTLTGRIDKP